MGESRPFIYFCRRAAHSAPFFGQKCIATPCRRTSESACCGLLYLSCLLLDHLCIYKGVLCLRLRRVLLFRGPSVNEGLGFITSLKCSLNVRQSSRITSTTSAGNAVSCRVSIAQPPPSYPAAPPVCYDTQQGPVQKPTASRPCLKASVMANG